MTTLTLYGALALLIVALLWLALKWRHNCLPWNHKWLHYPAMKICTNEGCEAYRAKWKPPPL